MRRSPQPQQIVVLVIACLVGLGLTTAIFITVAGSIVAPRVFFTALLACHISQVLFFAHLGFVLGRDVMPDSPLHAVRIQTTMLAFCWCLFLLITGVVAVTPDVVLSGYARNLGLIQAGVTFGLGCLAWFVYRQAATVHETRESPQYEREVILTFAGDLGAVEGSLRKLAFRHPAHAVRLDGLEKRLDTLRSLLSSVTPSHPQRRNQLASPQDSLSIQARLQSLHDTVVKLETEEDEADFLRGVDDAQIALDRAVEVLRQREALLVY